MTRKQRRCLLHDIECCSVSRRLHRLGRYCCQDTPLAEQLFWLEDGWAFAEEQSAARGERRFLLGQVRLAAARRITQCHRVITVAGAVQHVCSGEDKDVVLAEDILSPEETIPASLCYPKAQKEADANPFSVLSSLDDETLIVLSEETGEELKDSVSDTAPEMKMTQDQEEQLEDCVALNADWTVVKSLRQRREEMN